MASKLNFANNNNGKLLGNDFPTVRLHDGTYKVGQERDICIRHNVIGTAVVTSVCQFLMKDLPDTIAFPECGGDAEHLKRMLYRFYAGANVHDSSLIDVVTLHWTDRPPDKQEDLFKNFWATLEENFTPTLFNSNS